MACHESPFPKPPPPPRNLSFHAPSGVSTAGIPSEARVPPLFVCQGKNYTRGDWFMPLTTELSIPPRRLVNRRRCRSPPRAAAKVPPKVPPEQWETRKNGGKGGELGGQGDGGRIGGGGRGTGGNGLVWFGLVWQAPGPWLCLPPGRKA